MIGKSMAILSMVAVLGIAIVSKAKSPTRFGGAAAIATATGAALATISRGAPVNLADHASTTCMTVFEFYADW